jgi:hypothetical protein
LSESTGLGFSFCFSLLVPQGRDVHNRRWSEAQPPVRTPPTPQAPQGRDVLLVVVENRNLRISQFFYNLAPAGLCVWEACFRRLRYRSTAGYAHLAPCGAKDMKTKNQQIFYKLFYDADGKHIIR